MQGLTIVKFFMPMEKKLRWQIRLNRFAENNAFLLLSEKGKDGIAQIILISR